MKNKTGTIIGFMLGVGGFLWMFKLAILDRIPPEDELAPGITVCISLMNGTLFAFAGHFTQDYLFKKRGS